MKKFILSVAVLFLATFSQSSESLKPSSADYEDARYSQNVILGEVIDVFSVDLTKDTTKYQLFGATTAGYIARSELRDKGEVEQVVGTLAAGLLGKKIGKKVGKKRNNKEGIQLIIKLQNDRTIGVVQEIDDSHSFKSGDKVYIVGSGRNTRVLKSNF